MRHPARTLACRLALPVFLTLLSGCVAGAEQSASTGQPAAAAAGGDSLAGSNTMAGAPTDSGISGAAGATAGQAGTPGADTSGIPSAAPGSNAVVRGLYVNRFAAVSRRKLTQILAIADSTQVNALVVDMKDEFGLNYDSDDPDLRRNEGTMGKVRDVRALTDTIRAHGLLPIARLVVFKDSVAARMNPDEVIRQPGGAPWRDRQGLTWVNPYSPRIREYNLKVAEELVRLGFQEIQWDYIRFPEPYKSLPPQIFPGSDGVGKPDALAAFLKEASTRLHTLGVRNTADIFGLVTTVNGALEVGQEWEKLAPVTDVLLPMVYPSHYPSGSFGIARPNAEPYQVVHTAIARARERNAKLGVTGEQVRPYLQAFTLGKPEYGAEEVRQQIRAVNDAGFQGWVLWHPGSSYLPFVDALRE